MHDWSSVGLHAKRGSLVNTEYNFANVTAFSASAESDLQLFQRYFLLAIILCDQEAVGLHTSCIVFHVQGDGAPGFGTPTHMVELKSHQGLHQGCSTVTVCSETQDVQRGAEYSCC